MSLELFKVILQALSSFAIAGGLIYAAIQFRQARTGAHVANFTKLVELQLGLRRMRVDDPSLAHVYKHDVINLTTDREIREYFFNLMQLSVFEIVWFSHREGQLPTSYFRSWEARMRDIAAETSFRDMLTGPNMKIMHDDFHRYIMDMVRSVPERRTEHVVHAAPGRDHSES